MKKLRCTIPGLFVLFACAVVCLSVKALPTDTVYIPERAVVLYGDAKNADREVLAVFYSRENLAFSDPDAPRFLLMDRQGKIAFGVGGQLYGTVNYDFDGSIPGSGFSTYDISVPDNSVQHTRFGGDLSHSSLFMKLVGKAPKLGMYQVYFQANFTGNNGKYGFMLKQAYVSLGHFTAGLTNSTFIDAATKAPTVDTEGPSGQVSAKNVLFRYTSPTYKGFTAAASLEIPQTTYTTNAVTEALAARFPDIPVYIQYSWKPGQHVRLSGIFRDMAYRNTRVGANRMALGWGLQVSAIGDVCAGGMIQAFGHVAYGQGIAKYINDLAGNGYDLVPTYLGNRLTAPEMMGWTVGMYYNYSPQLFFTAAFSRAQLFNVRRLGGETYQYGQYLDVNGFYNFDSNFRVGAEYLHGWRHNFDGEGGSANRINLLVQYSF
ncbi:MAG: porin [Muribaculaceae bacterium]|nr:porin [Muribaculaceae bacterium]